MAMTKVQCHLPAKMYTMRFSLQRVIVMQIVLWMVAVAVVMSVVAQRGLPVTAVTPTVFRAGATATFESDQEQRIAQALQTQEILAAPVRRHGRLEHGNQVL